MTIVGYAAFASRRSWICLVRSMIDSGRAPSVTVVIPYYGAAAWIEAALLSVLAQDYPAFDIVLVNDGSPDAAELRACVARLATHPAAARLRVVDQANAGPSAARNRGIREATGSYLAFLDADDAWAPTLLSRAVQALMGPPMADLVFFDGWTVPVSGQSAWRITTRSPTVPEPALEDLLGGKSTVITSGVVVRRDLVVAAGGFDEGLWRSEDFDLWLRLVRRGARIRAVGEPLVHRRLQATGLSAQVGLMRAAVRTVLARQLSDPTLPRGAATAARRFDRALRREEALDCAKEALRQGRPDEARRAACQALRVDPSVKRLVIAVAVGIAPRLVAWRLRRALAPHGSSDVV